MNSTKSAHQGYVNPNTDQHSATYRTQVIEEVRLKHPAAFAYWQATKPAQIEAGYLPDACMHTGARVNAAIGYAVDTDTGEIIIKPRRTLAGIMAREERARDRCGLHLVTVDELHTVTRFDRLSDWQRARTAALAFAREISPNAPLDFSVEISATGRAHAAYICDLTSAVKAADLGAHWEAIEEGGIIRVVQYLAKPVQAVNCGHYSEDEGWRYATPDRAAEGVANLLLAQQDTRQQRGPKARLPQMSGHLPGKGGRSGKVVNVAAPNLRTTSEDEPHQVATPRSDRRRTAALTQRLQPGRRSWFRTVTFSGALLREPGRPPKTAPALCITPTPGGVSSLRSAAPRACNSPARPST
ncbi:hypothetical protein DEDE109153_02270 [Deinococcus deserti]|uniref:Uncharacterized protein n=1 Tax=Deinococcus deserti (strain DSM 17065 / CIP 109153 / LMG 22923 / VCD115) TaxID=546414 RepID=C1CV02_DEIDV|nr:hypothetical protein [Deinococcus deserti]ACO46019.1 Hypothetical protein Deide_11190 [Deinococcus deserti VCD115]